MRSPLERVTTEAITNAIEHGWGLRVDELRYLPEGGGAYHWVARAGDAQWFVTCDDLNTKPWLGANRDTVFARLVAAYGAAVELLESGAEFVVAPVPSAAGAGAERIDDRHSVSVFPFVDGAPGCWGERLAQGEPEQLVTLLGRLHACSDRADGVITRDVDIVGRDALEAALDNLDATWEGGPFSEEARRALTSHAPSVAQALHDFDRLAARVHALEPSMVLTHGEPHPGNLIRSACGLALVDWDTIALARPERDLWMLAEIDPALLDRYRQLTGVAAEPDALRAFRLVWAMSDLAAFTTQLRAEHGDEVDSARALEALKRIITDTEPRPYRPH